MECMKWMYVSLHFCFMEISGKNNPSLSRILESDFSSPQPLPSLAISPANFLISRLTATCCLAVFSFLQVETAHSLQEVSVVTALMFPATDFVTQRKVPRGGRYL